MFLLLKDISSIHLIFIKLPNSYVVATIGRIVFELQCFLKPSGAWGWRLGHRIDIRK